MLHVLELLHRGEGRRRVPIEQVRRRSYEKLLQCSFSEIYVQALGIEVYGFEEVGHGFEKNQEG